MATGYGVDKRRHPVPVAYPALFSTAAGLVSTAREVARYSTALDAGQFLSNATRTLAYTPVRGAGHRVLPYGLGWFVSVVGGHTVVWHYGYWTGNSSRIVKEPSRGLTFVAASHGYVSAMGPTVWTIGHSTHPRAAFLEMLSMYGIEVLADVRRYPGSRRWPQFKKRNLQRSLSASGMAYIWIPQLGGRRRPTPDSPNTAWRSAMFRGYADYMATPAFAEGLNQLVSASCGLRTCIMCAEAVWWRCHRALIADVLKWQGLKVLHILGPTKVVAHPFTSAAHPGRTRLSYAS